MNKIDRKIAVLHALQEHGGQVSLSMLLTLLKNQFPERSVRRWLDELINEGSVRKVGQKKATKYQAVLFNKPSKSSLFTYL